MMSGPVGARAAGPPSVVVPPDPPLVSAMDAADGAAVGAALGPASWGGTGDPTGTAMVPDDAQAARSRDAPTMALIAGNRRTWERSMRLSSRPATSPAWTVLPVVALRRRTQRVGSRSIGVRAHRGPASVPPQFPTKVRLFGTTPHSYIPFRSEPNSTPDHRRAARRCVSGPLP